MLVLVLVGLVLVHVGGFALLASFGRSAVEGEVVSVDVVVAVNGHDNVKVNDNVDGR